MNRREFLKASAAAPAVAAMAAESEDRQSNVRWEQKLDGVWYFHPEHSLERGVHPQDPQLRDEDWPELDVPNFWRPVEYWLWDGRDGASRNLYQRELERVRRYRFDGYATRAGWYRRWVDVPKEAAGKRLFVKFWAVAMIAEVWWNGERVGSHLGMFGPFDCELARMAQPGMNLLTVFVAGGACRHSGDLDTLKTRGVTVDVASPWLDDLPQSVFWMCGKEGGGGIWQSVQLTATDRVRVADAFFQPRLDGARVEVTIDNGASSPASRMLRYTVSDFRTGSILTEEAQPVEVRLGAGQKDTITLELQHLQPRLWSPEEPNLYQLNIELWDGSRQADEWQHAVGFRTFEVSGNRFLLNGRPYFLRGATQPPYGLAPSDAGLAHAYFELMRAGNEQITAFNETGGNDVWSHAADVIGIGILDQGPWTWALQDSTDSPHALIEAWKKMHAELVVSVRNHPCILLRSINDEAWFHYLPPHALGNPPDQGRYFDKDRERRLRKWRIVSEVVKLTRHLDPTRPIGASGGYARTAEEWKDLEPLAIDDGDFDNIHVFHGTYGPSYFCLDVQRDIEARYSMGHRPLITDQAGTGYPDNDIGFVCDGYIDNVRTAQAWVGENYVYDPRLPFLDINGQIIKEGYEKIRRHKSIIAGWLIFSNCQWFRNVYDASSIRPYGQIYDAAKLALEPVLVSLENPNRHFVTGEKVSSDVYIVHDDIRRGRLERLRLLWSWVSRDGTRLGEGNAEMPAVDYYGTARANVELPVPAALPAPMLHATLCLDLLTDREPVSSNEYPVLLAERQWHKAGQEERLGVAVLGQDAELDQALHDLAVASKPLQSWSSAAPDAVVIVPSNVEAEGLKSEADALHHFVEQGGVMVFLDPSASQAAWLGFRAEDIPKHFHSHIWDTPAGGWGAEYVDLDKFHPLAAGLDPVNHMRWWNATDGVGPRVSDRVLSSSDGASERVSVLGNKAVALCTYVAPHGYYNSPWDFLGLFQRPVLVEAQMGKGSVMVSTVRLASDPISRRFFLNLLRYASDRTGGIKRVRYF